jgi:hypothetical protein
MSEYVKIPYIEDGVLYVGNQKYRASAINTYWTGLEGFHIDLMGTKCYIPAYSIELREQLAKVLDAALRGATEFRWTEDGGSYYSGRIG